MTQPGFESQEMSPGDCGSLKMKPSLAMLRNMKVYIIGTSVARSTAPGAKEFWTLPHTGEVPVGRFARAGMSGVLVDSDILSSVVSSGLFFRADFPDRDMASSSAVQAG